MKGGSSFNHLFLSTDRFKEKHEAETHFNAASKTIAFEDDFSKGRRKSPEGVLILQRAPVAKTR